MTYEQCAAYCWEIYCMPRILQRTYANADTLPQVVRECWEFPANRYGGGLIRLVHVDGWQSPVRPELTLEGEQVALFHFQKRKVN